MSGASIRARCDRDGRLVEADEPIARLQQACGGQLPGVIAVPQLSALVERSRRLRGRASARLWARTSDNDFEFLAEAQPNDDGFAISAHAWNERPAPLSEGAADKEIATLRMRASATIALDSDRRISSVQFVDADLKPFAELVERAMGSEWHVVVGGEGLRRLAGSRRWWDVVVSESEGLAEILILPLAPDDFRVVGRTADSVAMIRRTLEDYLPQALASPLQRAREQAEFLAAQAAGPQPEQYISYGSDILRSTRHLERLLQNFSSQVDSGAEGNATATTVDLPGTARNAISICRPLAAEQSIAIDFRPPDRPLKVIADETQVTQIILNLVGNALRYAPPGGAIRVEFASDAENGLMTVSDEGPGIAQQDRHRVFESYERLGQTDTTGTGLGLPIARTLARNWGGDLEVVDQTASKGQAKGAILALRLPLAQMD